MIDESGLLTVSVLGLVVNIIGLSCFHDLHHHDHGDNCSHGNSDGHNHSHTHQNSHEHLHNHEEHNHNHSNNHTHKHDHEHNAEPEDHGHGHNENVYGFFLHILADALGSVGVIISSLLIHYKGMYIADPI